jgi:hypothetical protein
MRSHVDPNKLVLGRRGEVQIKDALLEKNIKDITAKDPDFISINTGCTNYDDCSGTSNEGHCTNKNTC